MSEDAVTDEEAPKKGGKLGLIIGLVLAVALGGGSFYAVYSGMILGPSEPGEDEVAEDPDKALVTFVPIDPMIVSLGTNAQYQLRFNAQLEVSPDKSEDVAHLMPRILDVLNGYLRAVDIADLENPAALIRLRAQMLRRVQLVTGSDHVNDLLITEFVFG